MVSFASPPRSYLKGSRTRLPSYFLTANVPTRRIRTRASQDTFFKELDVLLQAIEDPKSEEQALELVAQRKEAGGLPAFGSLPTAVPKRVYAIEELRLNGIKTEALLSPKDNSLNSTRNIAQGAALVGLGAVAYSSQGDFGQVVNTVVTLAFGLVLDQVINQGGGEALIIDTLGRLLFPSYKSRVALHEAGHLLVAYLVGVLPRTYTLSSLDAFTRFRSLNVQAGTQFCDSLFLKEVQSGCLSSSSLDRYTCVALAGLVTEYLEFGQAEGGIGDILQLDGMFRAMQFSQMKADSEVRWAVLNVATMLRRYSSVHHRLAVEMDKGSTVGDLIQLMEMEVARLDASQATGVKL